MKPVSWFSGPTKCQRQRSAESPCRELESVDHPRDEYVYAFVGLNETGVRVVQIIQMYGNAAGSDADPYSILELEQGRHVSVLNLRIRNEGYPYATFYVGLVRTIIADRDGKDGAVSDSEYPVVGASPMVQRHFVVAGDDKVVPPVQVTERFVCTEPVDVYSVPTLPEVQGET